MKEAYKCKSADKARKRLQALVSWLERNGTNPKNKNPQAGPWRNATMRRPRAPVLARQPTVSSDTSIELE